MTCSRYSGNRFFYVYLFIENIEIRMKDFKKEFMDEAIRLSKENIDKGIGGPFGAVIVKDGKIIAGGSNKVTTKNDPTAHAEVETIREACKALNTFSLAGCHIYTSCEPCPMCLAAIYWARIDKIYYSNDKHNAAEIGFDDKFIYDELDLEYDKRKIPIIKYDSEEALAVFKAWTEKTDKIDY